MTAELLSNQQIWLDGYDLTETLNSVAFDYSCDALENTTFGQDTRSHQGGLKTCTAQVEGFYQADPHDAALYEAMGLADKVMSWAPSPDVGGVSYFFKGMTGDYTPIKGQMGQLLPFSAGMKTTKSPLIRGYLMANEADVDTEEAGSGLQVGAVPTGKSLYACLHVLAVDDPADELVVIVNSDVSDDFTGAETQRIEFDPMSAIGSQLIKLEGPITDTWYNVEWPTVTGNTPGFSFVVHIGIL